ncbi:MAG: tetratricopeptide repeat protein [Methylococcales symbiont of Hymedesmia sp. n. MRB-2018]|nr:MAG: tetratricopeptide repeat protein [Methylococcales symbiont of Hymedesmia sp. n. MRB-2018]KAF3982906.1 MAG: tetratricopeptide repeat protein [Methylococcales symbiont of Hymedesmia sp. n. MRB-2018]
MKFKSFIIAFTLLIQGCSTFYKQQSPAPVYGDSQASEPYLIPSEENDSTKNSSKPVRIIGNIRYPENKNQHYPYKPTVSHIPVDTQLVVNPLSFAIKSLVLEAERNSQKGDYESAVSIIERALRIESRNPTLTYKLAKLRLQQSKPRLAEDLAKKAALLSAQDRILKRQSWLLISEARKQQNNLYGAKEAKLKADNI